ncbi:tetratricopeptide repeat protein [Streptomyces sp. NPDC003635]
MVAWIVAEDEVQAMAGMDRLARALGLTAREDDSVTAARKARAWLETEAGPRTLLVFDNVPDPQAVRRWLPAAGGAHTVVTSTSHTCEDLGTPVRVEAFALDEALAYLQHRTGLPNDTDARALAEELGCLPLALGQAAAAMRTQHLTYRTVLDRIRAMPLDQMLLTTPGDPYPHGAAQAVLLAFRSVEDADPLARSLAGLIAILSPAGTPRTVLHACADLEEGRERITAAQLDATIGRMADASLLAFTLDGETVLMHRFTQRVLRDRSRHTGTVEELRLLAARMIAACRPARAEMWDRRQLVKHLILQTDALWPPGVPQTADPAIRELLLLRVWADQALWGIGDSSAVLDRGPGLVADCERLLGDDCETTMQARYGLALAYGDLGRHDDAIRLNQRIVHWYTATLGPEHPATLNLRNTLGNNYLESGRDFADPVRLETAVSLHEETHARYERLVGPDDALALRSGINLSHAYREAGRISDAVLLAERMLRESERAVALAPDRAMRLGRPTTRARAVLAQAYAADGRAVEALALMEEALGEASADLGADNPDTWDYRCKRAAILKQAGQPDAAVAELRQAATHFADVLGENSATTRRAMVQLADTCRGDRRFLEAIEAYEQALSICTHTLGTDNPITARVARDLTELHDRYGRTQRARRARRLLGRRRTPAT